MKRIKELIGKLGEYQCENRIDKTDSQYYIFYPSTISSTVMAFASQDADCRYPLGYITAHLTEDGYQIIESVFSKNAQERGIENQMLLNVRDVCRNFAVHK